MVSASERDTILAWFRKLVAHKFDGSRHCLYPRLLAHRSKRRKVSAGMHDSGWRFRIWSHEGAAARICDGKQARCFRCMGNGPAFGFGWREHTTLVDRRPWARTWVNHGHYVAAYDYRRPEGLRVEHHEVRH